VANEKIAYDKRDLRAIVQAFKAMDDQSVEEAKRESSALAQYAADKVKQTAQSRLVSGAAVKRVAEGVKVSKSSKIGEFSYGFASQRFSGGADTRTLWGGLEFGSRRYRQFPTRNKQGYFIYPTLRSIQPELVRQWEEAFSRIVRKFD
jgi:hypothetical protein